MDRLQVKNPLYPLVCLLSAVSLLVVGLMYAKHPLYPLFLLAVCLLYCAFGLWRITLKGVLVFIPVSAVFAAFSLLFQRSPIIAAQMAGRVMLLGISAIPMITLPPINLTRSMDRMGAPRLLTLGMLIAIRFVPIIGDELRRVREAMRTRGVRGSFYRAFIIPAMIRLVNLSDIMALSLETRAFSTGDEAVSTYKIVRFRARDALYCLTALGMLTGWMVAV
ncbi:MAG: energy-coupling factor transporter transmembrane component T family protein [Christensenellales bacterium]|jgi:energy-coupling factor transport system permease protein